MADELQRGQTGDEDAQRDLPLAHLLRWRAFGSEIEPPSLLLETLETETQRAPSWRHGP